MTFKVKDGIAIGTTHIFNNSGQLLVPAPTANALYTAVNIQATGDVTGNVYSNLSSNTSAAFTLKNSGVTAGTYGSTSSTPIIVVDAQGRITSASNDAIAIGSSVLTINGDTGTDTVTLGVEALLFTGGTGITSVVSSNTVTMNIDSSVALRADTQYIGNTAVTLNRAQNNLALTGISSVSFPGSTSGTTQLQSNATAGSGTLTLPTATGTLIGTGDTGTVTSAMIADGAIANTDISPTAAIAVSKLAASTISGVTLGGNLNALTIGTGLTGTSYNGSAGVNIAANNLVLATLTDTQTLTNKTLTNAAHNGSLTTFTDTTEASSATVAPVEFAGGVGIAKSLYVGKDLNLTGNIYIGGVATTISSNNLIVDDPILYIANNNVGNITDIGVVGHFTSGSYQHTGLIRQASSGIWKLFSNAVNEPSSTTMDLTGAIYDTLQIGALVSTVGNGTAPLTINSNTAVANLNVDLLDGQHGSYYTTAGNLTGTISTTVLGNSSLNIGTTSIALNRASATQTLNGVSIDGTAALATNISGGIANNVLLQTGIGVTGKLTNNITTTKNFLSQTGDGALGNLPIWSTVTKTDVGLSAVENTALSTWAGTTNITTLGTISSGTWSATTIAILKGGTGATDAATARTNLGVAIGSNVQVWSANLDAIVATTTNGFLKKTGTSTWAIDTNTYLTALTDTLQTVTTRGATSANVISLTNTTDATTLASAGLLISGGVSVAKSILVGGDIINANTTGTILTKETVTQTSIATASQTVVDSWPIATFRSAKYLVQISQGGSSYQVSEILIIHNGTTTFMTEYAAVETGLALASFASSVTGPGTTANLLVTMGSATAAIINIKRVAFTV
jgi:hypothetical protein